MQVVTETEEYTKIDMDWVKACQKENKKECYYCNKNGQQCLEALMNLTD